MGELAYKRDHGVLPIASSPLPQEMRIVMHWVLSSMGMSDSSVDSHCEKRGQNKGCSMSTPLAQSLLGRI